MEERVKFPLAGGKYRKPARVIATLLCYSGLAVWFFHFHVWSQYDRTRPGVPDVASGRVHAQNRHGHVVYLTEEEQCRLTDIIIVAVTLLGTGLFIGGLFAEGFVLRKPPKPWEKRRW